MLGEAGDVGKEVALDGGGEVAGAAERLGPQGGVQQLLHLGHRRHAAALVGPAPHPDDELLAVGVDEDLGGVVGAALVAEVKLGVVDDNPLSILEEREIERYNKMYNTLNLVYKRHLVRDNKSFLLNFTLLLNSL